MQIGSLFVTRLVQGVLGLLVAAATGMVVGAAGSFLQGSMTGLGLGLALTLAALMVGSASEGRAGAAVTLVGWLVVVLSASLRRPEGDLVIEASRTGYGWLLGGTVLGGLVVGLGGLAVPRRCRAEGLVPRASGGSPPGR